MIKFIAAPCFSVVWMVRQMIITEINQELRDQKLMHTEII